MQFTYYMPVEIMFGPGQLKELHTHALPGKRAMIVCGGNSIKKYGYLEQVQRELALAGVSYVVFDAVLANPVKRHVEEAAALARAEGCDFVLGLGGGSSIDSAKAVAMMSANDGDLWDYASGGSGKEQLPANPPLPVVSVTTTAGTGSEVDQWFVITKEDTQEKIGFGMPSLFPVLAVIDPELMLSIPPKFTAYQGMDALFHCLEGFIANVSTEMGDLYACKGMALIYENLPRAVANGNDIEARTCVAMGSMLGGMCEALVDCVSIHGIAHGIGAIFPHVPHGCALLMVAEAYYRFFSEKIPDRLQEAAAAMHKADFLTALTDLMKDCGVYGIAMSEYGINREHLPDIARNAMYTVPCLFEKDRYILSKDDVIAILAAAYR